LPGNYGDGVWGEYELPSGLLRDAGSGVARGLIDGGDRAGFCFGGKSDLDRGVALVDEKDLLALRRGVSLSVDAGAGTGCGGDEGITGVEVCP
jgi:hypothetical protein